MRLVEWLTPEEAVARIPSEAVLATGGFVGCGHPEALSRALGERFLREGKPADLTLVYAAGKGDGCNRGLNHLAERGLLRRVVGGHWNLAPRLGALAAANEIEAWSFPQGVISKMFRAAASGDPGVLSRVGLGTFVDPRLGGGRMNASTKKDLVQTIEIDGETLLFYRTLPVNAALIRATSSDSFGGLSFEHEANVGEALSIAQCAKRNGGIVIAQVERRVPDYSRDPKSVRVPGIFVDVVVIADPAEHAQTFRDTFCKDYTRQGPLEDLKLPPLPPGPRRAIASRALAEVPDGAILNLGIGMPEALAQLASERGCLDRFTLTLEVGLIGGVPAGGLSFGASHYPHAVIDQPYMFDFLDGGGLDVACLSMAECDASGNVNVSRFGCRTPGPGGFINIAQSTKKVVFVGTLTAGSGPQSTVRKFVQSVQQITFSGDEARRKGQTILYITERAVFRLTEQGIELTEVAPGLDVRQDVLAHMEFMPQMSPNVRIMDTCHF
jgi:propionate CoA-transferase